MRRGRARRSPRALAGAAAVLLLASGYASAADPPAPELHFERIGSEGGPPPAVITSLHQDAAGFIWIGSRNGLIRFDGYGYEHFQHDPSDPGSLSDSTIRTIYEERDGTLWFGTNTGGLDRFEPATRSFLHFRHDGADPGSLSHDSVYAICRDRRGVLWVGTQKGLNRYDPASGTFTRILAGGPEGLASEYILTLYEDRKGRLWVGTLEGGLHRWDPDRGRFDVFRHDPRRADTLVDDRVFALLDDAAGRLWVGTYEGLSRMDPDRGTFQTVRGRAQEPERRQASIVSALAPGEPGRIWVGTHGGGLASLDTATGRLQYWRHEQDRRDSLSEDKIIALLTDHEGALWIGTWGGGLDRLSPISQRLDGPGGAGFPPPGVADRDVTTILRDRAGAIWAGTRTGYLARMDQATGRNRIVLRGGDEGIGRTLTAVVEDHQGRVWVGTSSGLLRFDPRSGELSSWTHDPKDPTSIGPGYLTAVLEDRAGRLWVGTGEGGLQRIDADGRVLQSFPSDPHDPGSLSDDYVTVLLEDRRGILWVGTRSGGLNEFDPATGRARRYLPAPGDSSSLGHRYVTSLLEDARGRLWVGTGGAGLNRAERAEDGTTRFVRITERQGLIDDDVTGILEDDDASLWVTTRRGLSRFQPDRNTFTNLFVSDGLPAAEFEAGAAARGRELLFFGTVRGLVTFPAGTAFLGSKPSPVVVRSIRTESGELPLGPGGRDADGIELPYGAWLSIDLAVLDFNPELEHGYAYRLENDWIELGAQRQITFTSLRPGTHALRVRGRNSQGVWGEASAPLRITVVPPFWMTVQFRLLMVGAVVGLALAAHLRRTSVLEKRNRELVQLHRQREKARQDLDEAYQRLRRLTRRLEVAKEDERKLIARELHDEMGPSLTAVIINLHLLSTQKNPEQFERRIEDTVDLVDRMIQRIRDMSLDLRPPLIDELGLVPALSGYLENVSERTGIKIHMTGDRELGRLPAHVPITAFRVVQESVTNAIRHSGAGRVDVEVRRNGFGLDLSVEDNGKGFDVAETMDRAASGKAIGLLGMQERVGMLGGEIDIDSAPGKGTRIRVRLPLLEAA